MPSPLQGFLIGLAIAAPVGPIGVLCIRRTLANGMYIGFISGLGAATADTLYGAVAAFGLTEIEKALLSQRVWLHWIGGLFLLYLGVRTLLSRPAESGSFASTKPSPASAYVSTLGLTLTNPATIISFTLIFAGLRVADSNTASIAAAGLVAGVFLGSATWWLTLSSIVGMVRGRFNMRWMVWVNRIAGVVILGFGVAAFILG